MTKRFGQFIIRYASWMSAVKRICPIPDRPQLHHDTRYWNGTEPHKISFDQMWQRVGQQWGAVYYCRSSIYILTNSSYNNSVQFAQLLIVRWFLLLPYSTRYSRRKKNEGLVEDLRRNNKFNNYSEEVSDTRMPATTTMSPQSRLEEIIMFNPPLNNHDNAG